MKRIGLVSITNLGINKGQGFPTKKEVLAALAQQLKAKLQCPLNEITVLCSESPAARETGEVFETCFRGRVRYMEELWCGDGRAANYAALHKLIGRQRTDVVLLITGGDYAKSYAGYHTIVEKFPQPAGKLELNADQCILMNVEKIHDEYRTSEILTAVVEKPEFV